MLKAGTRGLVAAPLPPPLPPPRSTAICHCCSTSSSLSCPCLAMAVRRKAYKPSGAGMQGLRRGERAQPSQRKPMSSVLAPTIACPDHCCNTTPGGEELASITRQTMRRASPLPGYARLSRKLRPCVRLSPAAARKGAYKVASSSLCSFTSLLSTLVLTWAAALLLQASTSKPTLTAQAIHFACCRRMPTSRCLHFNSNRTRLLCWGSPAVAVVCRYGDSI